MNIQLPSPTPVDPGSERDPLRDRSLYFNREVSQLDFNFRVLAQAMDPQVPLLERLKPRRLIGQLALGAVFAIGLQGGDIEAVLGDIDANDTGHKLSFIDL